MQQGWPKACKCGETWSRDEWNELPPVGRYRAEEMLELRTCVCGANLAVSTKDLGEGEGEREAGTSAGDEA